MRRALATAAICAVALAGCGGSDESDTSTAVSEPEVVETNLPPEEDFLKAGGEKLDVVGDWMAAGAGSIWLTGSTEVRRLDPADGHVETINLPETPCNKSVFAFGAYWTATCVEDGLARIDPESNEVTHVSLPTAELHDGNGMIAAGEGSVWLITDGKGCGACVLTGVDPQTLDIAHEIRIEAGASSVGVGAGSIWVTNPKKSLVQQIDPSAEEVTAETEVGESPQYLAVDETGVWVFKQLDGSVARLDPVSGELEATIEADMAGAGGTIIASDGMVWVRGALALLAEIDPATNEVVRRYSGEAGTGDVLLAYDALWTSRPHNDKPDLLKLRLPTP